MNELKLKRGMTYQEIIDMLNEFCYYNDDSGYNIHIVQNLYKNYDQYPLRRENNVNIWTEHIICSYEDFCKLYKETGGVVG